MHKITRSLLIAIAAVGTVAPVSAEMPKLDGIPICYNFGCNTRQLIRLSEKDWAEVEAFFTVPARAAEEERKKIVHATGWLEVIAGRYTPIYLDKGMNNIDYGTHGQMDCIDESMNMLTYLKLIEAGRLLRFHRVLDRAYRRTLWDQHWAGEIEDLKTGQRWVVDSWFHDFGRLPYLQTTQDWLNIPFFFTSYIDNTPDR